jgi:hypothetical protein
LEGPGQPPNKIKVTARSEEGSKSKDDSEADETGSIVSENLLCGQASTGNETEVEDENVPEMPQSPIPVQVHNECPSLSTPAQLNVPPPITLDVPSGNPSAVYTSGT